VVSKPIDNDNEANFTGTDFVERISFDAQVVEGQPVNVTERSAPNESISDVIQEKFVGANDDVANFTPAASIGVRDAPSLEEGETATISGSVNESDIEDPSALTVVRIPDDQSSAERLPTNVTNISDGTISFEATTTNFSTFVVGEEEASTAKVTGSLTAASGAPLENDTVFIRRETADGVERYNDTVDAGGNFSVAVNSTDGTYTLAFGDTNDSASLNGVPDLYAIEEVTPSEEVNAELPKAHNVTIRVTDEEEKPVENASVVLGHVNGDAVFADEGENVTNEDGLVSIDGRTQLEFDGEIFVGARTPANDTAVERVNVTSETEINLTATPEPRVHGTLTAESGAPLEGSELALVRTADGEVEAVHNTTVGEDGGFEILNATEDRTYDLVFIDDGPNASSNGVPDRYALGEVTPPVPLGTVELPRAYNATFEVTDRDGNPIENANVTIRHANNDAVIREDVPNATNQDGVFSVNGRTQFEVAGDITVGAEYRGVRNATSVNVSETGPDTVVVELPVTAEVSGRLKLPDGSNATSDIVAFRGTEIPEYSGTVTSETGSFTTTVPNEAEYDVRYAQSESTSSTSVDPTFPLDGVPDLHPVSR
jgi:hypothetical protein